MKKKEELSLPKGGLKIANPDAVPETPEQVLSLDAIFRFVQDVETFDKGKLGAGISLKTPEISSLAEIQSRAKKSVMRLRTHANQKDGTNPDNVESISSEGHRTKTPLSGRKGR